MATNYSNTSPYFDTPVINNQYLGLMIERPIPKLVDDLSMTINETYNLRPDLLAFDLYEDSNLWWVFAMRNQINCQILCLILLQEPQSIYHRSLHYKQY